MEANILIKANQAIRNTALPEHNGTLPKVIGINKFPSGAFFLEMDSKSSADLLQQTMLTSSFMKIFSDTSIIKSNNYLIIAEFTPTTFNPMSQEDLAKVETANSLLPGNIATARWIKPPEKQSNSQTTAHLILHLHSRSAANTLIRLGILIASTSVTARKLLQEAKRCLKSQKLGTLHLAAQCPQSTDTCCQGSRLCFLSLCSF